MSQDYGQAVWLGNDQIGFGGWGFFTPKWIVVHGTAGDATIEAVQRTFVNKPPSDKSSTHFAVGQDGRVGQYVPESEAAWGNGPITGPSGHAVAGAGNAHDSWWDGKGNANPYTYSIEHCKPDTHNASALTPAQKAASFALIKHLCEAHGIPKRVYGTSTPPDANGGVSGHFSMDPLNRAFCPGTYPWQELQDYLDGKTTNGGQTIVAMTLERDAAGNITGAHNQDKPAIHIGKGAAILADQQGLLGEDITLGEQPGTANGQPAALWVIGHRYVGAYGQAGALRMEDWFELAQQVEALAARANQPAPAPAPADPVKEKAFAALQDLKSALAEL